MSFKRYLDQRNRKEKLNLMVRLSEGFKSERILELFTKASARKYDLGIDISIFISTAGSNLLPPLLISLLLQ